MPPVPKEARELARGMAINPIKYHRFGNTEGILPNEPDYYVEAEVDIGQREGRGQYRVVCLVYKNKVIKKYWSATHYGTGEDTGRRPDFVEFE